MNKNQHNDCQMSPHMIFYCRSVTFIKHFKVIEAERGFSSPWNMTKTSFYQQELWWWKYSLEVWTSIDNLNSKVLTRNTIKKIKLVPYWNLSPGDGNDLWCQKQTVPLISDSLPNAFSRPALYLRSLMSLPIYQCLTGTITESQDK